MKLKVKDFFLPQLRSAADRKLTVEKGAKCHFLSFTVFLFPTSQAWTSRR